MMLLVTQNCLVLNDRMTVNNEVERIWKDEVIA
jgi:hypothetical protein